MIVTKTKKEEAKSLKDKISVLRDESSLIEKIAKGGSTEDYIKTLFRIAIPYLVFAGFSSIGFLFYSYCACFDTSCPPCKTWRRDLKEKPYSEDEFSIPAYVIIFFSICAIGASVYGFMIS